MKVGKGGDILVSNVIANPLPQCIEHSFSEWEPAEIWDIALQCGKEHGMERICKDCGRYEWTEGASA